MINTKNILTVDDATTISDNDTLFVGQNSQLKQIDYDLLADAILNKISSKSYSELDTTAKTLIGAIDELNRKWQPECEMIFNETEETKNYNTEIPENSIIFACKKTNVSTASIFTFNSSISDSRINFIGNSNDIVYMFTKNSIQIAPNVIVRIYKFK